MISSGARYKGTRDKKRTRAAQVFTAQKAAHEHFHTANRFFCGRLLSMCLVPYSVRRANKNKTHTPNL
jgi:hypothetical protein